MERFSRIQDSAQFAKISPNEIEKDQIILQFTNVLIIVFGWRLWDLTNWADAAKDWSLLEITGSSPLFSITPVSLYFSVNSGQ